MLKTPKQKINTFGTGFALPGQPTSLRLSAGRYSLSSRSNVPYVRFAGSKGFSKTISWGEWAEIDCDQLVTVENASAHGGDIYINSGVDPDPLPSRITVPIQYGPATEFDPGSIGWLDTRRAKRAYFVMRYSGTQATLFRIYGVTTGTHRTENQIVAPGEQGPGYIQDHTVLGNIAWPPIPLGYNTLLGDDSRPHTLLDKVRITVFGGPSAPTAAYYILEYL